jgi:ppGpp synthetase/RelA/SpoT-type nucleotidyltranferase
MVPTKPDFLTTFKLSEGVFENAGMTWEQLASIGHAHVDAIRNLQQTAAYIAETLRALEAVHSVKVRIKQPAHLIEKILRKRQSDPERQITPENYRREITDLIGIRALHLFKEEWLSIHRFIQGTWSLVGNATANVRAGDQPRFLDLFREEGCKIYTHPAGYRSVHYLIQSQPTKDPVIAELQVRTIFEEGWSEIDHRVRYPYDTSNSVLGELLEVFNRLAGSADEMGSFVQGLKQTLSSREQAALAQKSEYEAKTAGLKEQIAKLNITAREKKELEEKVKELEKQSRLGAVSPQSYQVSVGGYVPSTLAYTGVRLDPIGSGAIPFATFATDSPTGFVVAPKCTRCGATLDTSAIGQPFCNNCLKSTLVIRG